MSQNGNVKGAVEQLSKTQNQDCVMYTVYIQCVVRLDLFSCTLYLVKFTSVRYAETWTAEVTGSS